MPEWSLGRTGSSSSRTARKFTHWPNWVLSSYFSPLCLELPIDRIKVIGGSIVALGIAQIGLTTLAIAAAYFLATGDVGAALLTGGALALSSTAVVLRLLSERREITNRFGRSAVAVLLIQDLAFGPMLVLVLALEHDAVSPIGMVGFALLKGVIALVIILVVGRLILRPLLFHPVASSREPEIVAALTFLTILCIGLLAQFAGLSMEFWCVFSPVFCSPKPIIVIKLLVILSRCVACSWVYFL